MKRIQLEDLYRWKNNKRRKPLIVNGARQVGKTWLLREFGRIAYEKVAYLTCDKDSMIAEIFSGNFDVHRIIMNLSARTHIDITPETTLIILDEVQSVPKVLESLKYFCEDAPQYHVAVAGSLLGIELHQGNSFPVGKVDMVHIFPMNFEEFLMASGKDQMAELLRTRNYELINTLLPAYTDLLRQYYFVGGMPAAVASFVSGEGLKEVRKIQNQILFDYKRDFSKHAPVQEVPRINMVWNSIVSQLFKENKKFIYNVMKKGARAKEFEIAIQWLVDSGLVYQVFRSREPQMPLKAYEDMSAFKLFFLDLGLLGAMAEVPSAQILIGDSALKEFKGGFTEQYVFQQMRSNSEGSVYYYSADNSRLEIDFLVQNENGIVPIEVKAGGNVRATSLNAYLAQHPELHAIRYSMLPYKKQDRLVNIPLCAVR